MGVAAPDLSVAQIEEEFTEAFEYNPNPFPLLGRGAHRVEHRLPPYGEASTSTWRTLGCPAICNGRNSWLFLAPTYMQGWVKNAGDEPWLLVPED